MLPLAPVVLMNVGAIVAAFSTGEISIDTSSTMKAMKDRDVAWQYGSPQNLSTMATVEPPTVGRLGTIGVGWLVSDENGAVVSNSKS